MFQCPQCQPRLLDHAYGLLSPEESAAVELHLGSCLACREEFAKARGLQGLIAQAAKAGFPEAKFAPPAATPKAAPAGKSANRWLPWAVAAAVLVAVGALGVPALRDTAKYAKHRPEVDAKLAEVNAAEARQKQLRGELAARVKAAADRKQLAEQKHKDLEEQWINAEIAAETKRKARPFQAEILGPRTAIPGAPNEYRLNITDAAGRPFSAKLTATVKSERGVELFAKQFDADKNPDGNVLRIPAGIWAQAPAGEEVFLHLSAIDPKTGVRSEITENLRMLEPVYATFLTTDKPMYRPGETVFFRSLTLDRTRFLPPQKETTLRFEIKAPSGQVLPGSEQIGLAKPVALTREGQLQPVVGPDGQPVRGIGTGMVPLGDDLAGGEYALSVWEVPQPGESPKPSHAKPLATRKFIVNKYTPDRFVKKLEFDGRSYGPGDVVQAKFELRDQAKPLPDAALSILVDVDGQPIRPDVAPAKTDAEGFASIKFTLPKRDAIREARINITATANGITESLPRRVPLATRTLEVEFFPEGGDLVQGVPNRVYFRATNSNGQPADITGVLTDGVRDLAEVQTLKDADHPGVNQGLGAFTFTPEAGRKYALKLHAPIGVQPPVIGALDEAHAGLVGASAAAGFRGYLLPAAVESGLVLGVPNGVVAAGEAIRVTLASTAPRTVFVGAYTRGRPVGFTKVAIPGKEGIEAVLESTDPKLGGVTRITVFDLPNDEALGKDDLKPLAERLIYRKPAETLKLAYTARKANGPAANGAFVPGSRIALDITSKDETDAAKPAILWAAVVNSSVLAMADEKTERLLPTHFLLTGEVQKGEQLEHADFLLTDHPKAPTTLDLLLGTQGWRRFAEQAPLQFRQKVPAEEAERLILANSMGGPIPNGWRSDLRNVFEKYWPKYEASLIELEEAEVAKARIDNDFTPLQAIGQADMAYVAKVREFAGPAAELQEADGAMQQRRQALPYLLTGLLTLAAAGFAIRYLAFAPGAAARTPLGIGSAGLMVLALFLGAASYYTGKNNDGWRDVAKVSLPPLQNAVATAEPDDLNRVVPANGALEIDEAARAPVMEALKMQDAKKEMKLAKQLDKAGGFEPMALNGAAKPGMIPPPVAAMPLAEAVPQGIDRDALGGARRGPGRAAAQAKPMIPGPGPVARFGQEQEKLAAGMPFERQLRDAAPADFAMQARAAGNRLDKFLRKRDEQFQLRKNAKGEAKPAEFQENAAKEKHFGGERASVVNHFAEFLPQYDPFVVREYAHTRTAPANGADSREDFAETLVWQPLLVTPKNGTIAVEFSLADAIQPYRVLIAGHTTDGRVGAVTGTIEVRKPFSLDAKLPQEIGSNDQLLVPVTGTNATDETLRSQVKVLPTGFQLNGSADATIELPASGGNRLLVRMKPDRGDGKLALELRGQAGTLTDNVQRTVTVVPDGFPAQASMSDVLESSFTGKLDLPEMLIPGTLKLRVTMYPNMLSEVQAGLDGLLREPNGCFEQTSTTNYPNVLVLDYLTETNQAKPDVAKRAKDLLDRGYAKLVSFECNKTTPGKEGYEWFGGNAPPHEALTAYGLLQFTDMSRVHPVDPEMLKRTKAYLLAARNGQGGFTRNARALDTFGGAPMDLTDAYIVWAITESERSSPNPSDLTTEVAALLSQTKEGKRAKDPYFLALVANALLNRGQRAEGTELLKVLAGLQSKDGSLPGAETSITRSSGRALLIESTALAVLGWLKANEAGAYRSNVEPGCKFIGSQRDGGGSFGSTQSTILALKALIEFARNSKRPAESGEIRVLHGNGVIARRAFTTQSAGPIVVEIEDPEKVFANGAAELRVETDAKQSYPCTISWEARSRKPASSPACPIRLSTALDKSEATEGELLRLRVNVQNTADTDQGMVTAIIGIPAGVKLPEDMKQMKALMEKSLDGSAPKVSYWETRGRELILYWRGLGPKQSVEFTVDLLADLPGEYRGPASRAYLYYGAEHKHWVEPIDVKVNAK
jgi:hypothetical protein